MKFNLDLRNLTEDIIAEAMPHLGVYMYTAPCIIGAMVPAECRDEMIGLARWEPEEWTTVRFPEEQRELAGRLQLAFDIANTKDLEACLAEVRALRETANV